MEDRLVAYPQRYRLTKVAGTDDVYDIVPAPGEITAEGTLINKSSLLKDATTALYDLDNTAVPDDVLNKIHSLFNTVNTNISNISSRPRIVFGSYTGRLAASAESLAARSSASSAYVRGNTYSIYVGNRPKYFYIYGYDFHATQTAYYGGIWTPISPYYASSNGNVIMGAIDTEHLSSSAFPSNVTNDTQLALFTTANLTTGYSDSGTYRVCFRWNGTSIEYTAYNATTAIYSWYPYTFCNCSQYKYYWLAIYDN